MEVIKGFKVTDENMQCRGFQFEVDKEYKEKGNIKACNNGFHFCVELKDCFNYYSFNPNNRVFEVEGYGNFDTDGDKHCVEKIKFIKEISWLEVLNIVNIGKGNTGIGNAGYSNAGNRNAGNSNAGNYNAGNRNAGNYNAGNRNAGYSNAGNDNAGNSNAGNDNAGNYNAGNRNAGYSNAGNDNAGNYNAGNKNAGNSNAGNDNAGAFNNLEKPNYIMFNKPSKWSYEEFVKSDAYSLLQSIDTTLWVPGYKMSEEEKSLYPYFITTGGYIKYLPYKESFINAWNNWSDSAKQSFIDLPNFDADVFFDITGVRV